MNPALVRNLKLNRQEWAKAGDHYFRITHDENGTTYESLKRRGMGADIRTRFVPKSGKDKVTFTKVAPARKGGDQFEVKTYGSSDTNLFTTSLLKPDGTSEVIDDQ